MHRHADAAGPGFLRGTGAHSPNLFELAYFPDSGFGATLWPTVISEEGRFDYTSSTDFAMITLRPGIRYWLRMEYSGIDESIKTVVTGDGAALGSIPPRSLSPTFTDFRVDTFAIRGYSDEGSNGSLLAHGWVEEIRLELPPPPIGRMSGRLTEDEWIVDFQGLNTWRYTLERTDDWSKWQTVGEASTGSSETGWTTLRDPEPPPKQALYRIRAEKP